MKSWFALLGLFVGLVFFPHPAITRAATDDAAPAAADGDDEKQRQAAERFLVVLEKSPRRGTALDRLYGYHVEAGTLEQFVKTFEDRTAKNAKDGVAWMILGLIESQRGRDAAAVAAFTQAAKTLPDNSLAAFYLGQSLVLVGQPEEAAAAFEQAIARKPPRADLLDMFQALGRVYQRAQKSDQALAVWSRLEKLFPDDLRVQEQIATTLVEEGQPAQALPRFEALAAKVKDEYRAATYRIEAADLKVRLGQSQAALADFETQLSKLNPDNWLYRDVRRRIDDVFLRTDDQTGLAAYYETWVEKNKEDVDAMGRLARILAGLGRTPEAQSWLDKALKLAPSRKDLRLALIEQLLAEKQHGRAIEQYELLAKNDPNNPDTLRDWGRLILKDTSKPEAERKQAAAAVWRRLVEARPKDSLTATQVADLFRQSELVDEALALYKKAIDLSPDAAQYREYLGEYYHTLKRSDEALAVWREIAAGKQRTAENLARLAEVLAGFGYLEEGVAHILEACKLDDDEFKYPLKAAELLSRTEKYDEALKQLDAADKLADSPENAETVLQQRIRNLQLAERLEREVASLKKELGANRGAAARWYVLARYQEAARHFAESDQAIGHALALDEKSVVYRTAAARIAESAGNLQGAADAYRALAAIDRRFRTGHLTNVAKLEAQLGRTDQALQAGRELLAAAPGSLEHYEFFAQLCFRLGKVEQGLDALRRSARLNPGEPRALLTLAGALSDQFRNDEAIELYWRAFEKSNGLDGKLPVVAKLAELHLQSNHFDRLVERLNRLRREAQVQREMTICLAQAYQSAGDYGTARQELERLLTENTRDAQLLQQLSNLAESEGDLAATIKYQQSLNSVSPSKEAEMRLAQLLLRAGDTEAATAIWGRLAAAEEDQTALLVSVDSLLAHGSRDLALSITERLLRDQPQNWELLYREGAALAQDRPDEAARRFRDILALQLPDDERGVRATGRASARQRRPSVSPSSPHVIRFAGFSLQERSQAAGSIRRVIGFDNRDQYYGWGHFGGWGHYGGRGNSGRQSNSWAPADFGEARMASLGWLLHTAQSQGRTDEFLGELRPAPDKADPDSRRLWDWYYLQLVRNDEKESYETVRRLARTGELIGEWLLLESLQGRPVSEGSRRLLASHRNRNRNRADKTPPLAADELDHVLACYQSVRQKRPDLLADPDYGTTIIRNVLAELKRADRVGEETAMYRGVIDSADRLPERRIALDLAAARGDFETALAQFGGIATDLSADPLSTLAATTLHSAAGDVTVLMAARGKVGAHADILLLLERYLASAAVQARAAVISRPARARSSSGSNSGGGSYATVWRGGNRHNERFDYPTPNDYYDQSAISVLRQAYELYQRDDLVSDLVAHCLHQTETGPPADRLWWRLAMAYLHWWNDEKDEAADELVRAVDQAPDDQNLRMELADVYAQRDDPARALATADKVVPLNHEMLERRETMALRLAVRTGDTERARRAAERLFGLRLDAETQMRLSSEMRQLGMHDLAEGVLGRARRQAGNRLDALVGLMHRYQADQKPDSALEVAYLLLRQSPPAVQSGGPRGYDSASAARAQAIAVLVNSGRLKELIERAEQQLKSAPESVKLHQTLVEYYEAAGDKKQQLETLKRIAQLRPDDQRLRIQIAQQITASGKAGDALEHFRTALLKEPALLSRHFQEVLQAFQKAKKGDELLNLLDEIDLKAADGNQAAFYIAQVLYRDEKHREQAIKLFRRLWQIDPDQRASMLQTFRNDDVLQMPVVYDFAREKAFPRDAAALADPWTGMDQANQYWGNDSNGPLLSLVEIALKQNRLAGLRDDVAEMLVNFPDWRGGRALLAVIHARNHRPERAVPLIEELLGDETNPLPASLCGILAHEIENYGTTRLWAFKLYENQFDRLDALDDVNNLNWPILERLMAMYKSQGQIAKGRDLILKVSQVPMDDDEADPAAVAQHRYQMTIFTGYLSARFGLPLDAVRALRNLFDDEDLIRQLQQSAEDDSLQNMRQYYSKLLKLLVKEDPREAVAALLEPSVADPPREGPVLNLLLGVDGTSPNRRELNSTLIKTLRAVASSPELKSLVRRRTAELATEHPADLAAHILTALAAFDEGQPETIREACERLAALTERTPLEELHAGTGAISRANARQRILADRQTGLWLVARECLKLPELRALGERLASRALEAARRQTDRQQARALLREWGQMVLDRGDREAASARWTEQLELALGRHLKSLKPPPVSSNPKSEIENIRGWAPIRRELVPPARREKSKIPNPISEIPNPKSVPPLTLEQFDDVVQIAKRAGDCGLRDLSLLAMRESFEAGPPIADNSNNQRYGRGTSRLRLSYALPGNPSEVQPFAAVEKALAELVAIWGRTQMPAVDQYEVLAAAVLPAGRPAEIFLYQQPLTPDEFRRPRNVGRSLAATAVKAGRTDDLRQRVTARLDQPLAHVSALVLLAQLAVETGDEAAARAALETLLAHMQSDPLENSAELSCHAALPLLEHERLAGAAFPIVALAAQRLAVVSQQEQHEGEPSATLFLKLAGWQLERNDVDGARGQFQQLLEFTQKAQAHGNANWLAHNHKEQLQKVALEYARAGMLGEALDTLGQVADLPATEVGGTFLLGETLSLVAHAASRLPANRRYELLKSWTLPAADRQVVRILGGQISADESPEAFRPLALWNRPDFVRATGGQGPLPSTTRASGGSPEIATGTEISTAGLLIDAAREARLLEALSQELSEAAARDVNNASTLALLVRLEAGDAAVQPEIERLVAEAAKRSPLPVGPAGDQDEEEPDDNPNERETWADYLLVRACLRRAKLQDLGERRLRQLADQAGFVPGSMPSAGQIRRDLAAWIATRDPNSTVNFGDEPGLEYWQASNATSGPHGENGSSPGWVAHEGHIARLAGAQSNFLYLDYPLTGEFEFSAEVLTTASGGGSLGFCGLVFDALDYNSAELDMSNAWSSRRMALNRATAGGVWPMQHHEQLGCISPLLRPAEFNRLSLRVGADRLSFLVNDHLVYELSKPPRISPFLSLYAPGIHLAVFRNLTLTGNVHIPSEVSLTHGDELEGWVTSETQPDRLTRLNTDVGIQDDEIEDFWGMSDESENVDAAHHDDPGDYPWSARDGVIRARQPDEKDLSLFGQSVLRFHRPLRNGESLRYEFLYEPGETEVHTALGRLAFLLNPEGVRLHWITPERKFDPWSGLQGDNVVDEPQYRRGPNPLPLKTGDWNSLKLSLTDNVVVLELNEIEIYRRPLEPTNDRTFGFFRDPGRAGVQVRSVVLAGDWPDTLSPQQMGDLLKRRGNQSPESARQTRQALVGEAALVLNWEHVQMRARALPPTERYAALLDWVLPGPDHATFRLQGGFTPTSQPHPTSPFHTGNSAQPGAATTDGKRIITGGELTAPILDLIDVARDLEKLDELATRASRVTCANDFDRRSRLAVLALVSTARKDNQAAAENLIQLRPLLYKVSLETPEYQRWPEFIACTAALCDRKLAQLALDLLDAEIVQIEPKLASSDTDWTSLSRLGTSLTQMINQRMAQAAVSTFTMESTTDRFQGTASQFGRSIRVLRDRVSDMSRSVSPSIDRPMKQWSAVVHGTAESRGRGASPGEWRTIKGEARHVAGHDHEYMYFQSPLLGDFEMSCRLTETGRHEIQPGYAETWIALLPTRDKYEIGHYGRMSPQGSIAPRLADLDAKGGKSYEYRLVVRDETYTAYINGTKVYEQLLPANCDPWLVLHAQPAGGGTVRDLRIIGQPTIPETLDLLALSDLTGWMADYYGESTGENSGTWKKDGDELSGSRQSAQFGNGRQSLLRYHRPLLEDGQIEYDFYYEAGKTHVHPALDRLTLLVEPAGIRVHWLTDAEFDRLGFDGRSLPPGNVIDESTHRRGPKSLPLKEREWNRMKLALKGDVVSLWLNDVEVYQRPLEATNQRIFGLFHYTGESAVRVRNVSYRGNWPRALPAIADQELVAP